MRIRSEWLTLFTVTGLAAGALFFHRGSSPEPAAPKRPDMAAAGIDFTPVGTIHPLTEAHPVAKVIRPRAKSAVAHP